MLEMQVDVSQYRDVSIPPAGTVYPLQLELLMWISGKMGAFNNTTPIITG